MATEEGQVIIPSEMTVKIKDTKEKFFIDCAMKLFSNSYFGELPDSVVAYNAVYRTKLLYDALTYFGMEISD